MPADERPDSRAKSGGGPPISLWERLELPAPAPRSALTPQRIATVAVGIADAEGLDAVTMRRLATELGVAPMAAYRYVASKDELIDLMVDSVYGELAPPDPGAGWREAMRGLALDSRALLLAHPWITRTAVPALTPNQLAVPERALATLAGLGLDADAMMTVFRTVTAYVNGAVEAEITLLRLMQERGWSSGDAARTGLAPQMTWLMDTGRYPVFRAYTLEATRKDDPQWQFESGLDCVLDGIAARMGI
ncbi:TetR/AcrR family transcriptional regulator [Kitasatospora sp. NPDC057015]|uniref:TetR/AcrR family transcriptional regulator n=1 Tax=Kitasatospora sp. NPDC057015 TaxID=3346001 RepID=UPI003640A419